MLFVDIEDFWCRNSTIPPSPSRPVSPVHEQYIRQAALRYGWQHPIEFNGYVEDYLW